MAGLAISCSRSVVVETSRFPGVSAVAGGTLAGEVVVGFILVMARLAVGCTSSAVIETGGFPGIGAVAGGTLAGIMPLWGIWLVARLTILSKTTGVVKVDILPTGNIMTDLTYCPEPAIVGVILGVTCVTCRVSFLIVSVQVARLTFNIGMSAGQWKAYQRVIELSGQPTFRRVTNRTIFSQDALVDIVLEMAIYTGLGCIPELFDQGLVRMTCLTLQGGVFPDQGKGHRVVIKISAIGIDAIMAFQAGIAKGSYVRLHQFLVDQLVAVHTYQRIKIGKT